MIIKTVKFALNHNKKEQVLNNVFHVNHDKDIIVIEYCDAPAGVILDCNSDINKYPSTKLILSTYNLLYVQVINSTIRRNRGDK